MGCLHTLILEDLYGILHKMCQDTCQFERKLMKEHIIEEIMHLKKEKNAAIIAHYYQDGAIQDIADFVGDSLAMAKYGKASDKDTLVICGVRFMAESAKILSPEKTILLANSEAGCPMADMVDEVALKAYKEANPDRLIVSYVNTSAHVKALTDVCVTSSNAMKVIQALDKVPILFLPDKNLGAYIKSMVPDLDMALWQGFCFTHDRVTRRDLELMIADYPGAKILIHPECDPSVVALGDYVGSTAGIIAYANKSTDKTFIIVTEEGVLHPLRKENPDKTFILATTKLSCRNMKKTNLTDILACLKSGNEAIQLETSIIEAAKRPLDRMLALS